MSMARMAIHGRPSGEACVAVIMVSLIRRFDPFLLPRLRRLVIGRIDRGILPLWQG